MHPLCWIGARSSDIKGLQNVFDSSITYFGEPDDGYHYNNSSKRRVNHNIFSNDLNGYVLEKQRELIDRIPDIKFMAYNPNYTLGAPEDIREATVCLNPDVLMNQLDNKIEFHRLVDGIVPLLPYVTAKRGSCACRKLQTVFPDSHQGAFIVQAPISSGGEGTYLLTEENGDEVNMLLDDDIDYLVTPYIWDNIPVNLHCVIYDDEVLVLPGSVQIITNSENRLLYQGADFLSYSQVDISKRELFTTYCLKLGLYLQSLKYRGVIGFDALITQDNVYLVEANNRFQGSTILLNRAFIENGLPSVHELNLEAFKEKERSAEEVLWALGEVLVPYSYFVYINNNQFEHAEYLLARADEEETVVLTETDGLSFDTPIDKDAYLFYFVFNTNITSIDNDNAEVRLHPNLLSNVEFEMPFLSADDLEKTDVLYLKTALLNDGIWISDRAKQVLTSKGLWDSDGTHILDLKLRGVWINSPLKTKLAKLSRFSVDVDDDLTVFLKYYEHTIAPIEIDCKRRIAPLKLNNGSASDDIVFFCTDRIRVQHYPSCIYSASGTGCRFCEVFENDASFTLGDVEATLDYVFKDIEKLSVKHVLVGGRTAPHDTEKESILRICRHIRHWSGIPIYVMALPPTNLADIDEYVAAGATEFGFNIEIFNRTVAKRVMPGKGEIPLDHYLTALQYAADIIKEKGAVRTAFIVGLEPVDSLYEGIRTVCELGVSPILSPFRPIPGTPMANHIPLDNLALWRIAQKAETICEEYGLTLGPSCEQCRNNTLNVL